MRLEKISLVIVIICAIILLAVPFYRNIASSQLRYVTPGREKSIWKNDVKSIILTPRHKTDAQLLKEHPKDFMLRLALTLKDFETNVYGEPAKARYTEQMLRKLQQDYPDNGVVYALTMETPTYSRASIPQRIEGYGVTPEDIAKYGQKPKPATKEQLEGVHRCIKLLNKAITADPDNGWFHYQKALYLYGLHQDDEALREIHLSAIAPNFVDYNVLCAKSIDHLFDLRGDFNPAKRCSVKSTTTFYSTLVRMRDGARITAHLAYKDIRLGNTNKGIQTALDLTNVGYKMTKSASTFIHGIVGKAIMLIGASSLDPAFTSKTRNDIQIPKRIAHYGKFLIDHGYPNEAKVLGTQGLQIDRFRKKAKASLITTTEDEYNTPIFFSIVFATATGVLTIALLFIIAWIIAALITRKSGRTFWDKPAAITSTLLCSLVFAPLVTDLVMGKTTNYLEAICTYSKKIPLLPVYLLIPSAIMVTALLSGLIVMLKRTPKDGENRRMPITSLLIAWFAAVGGLVYLTYGLEDFAQSNGFFESLKDIAPVLLILGPIVAIVIYAIIRAVQSRFGRVKKNAVLTFAATIRYASVVPASIFSIAYLCLVMATANLAIQSDVIAKKAVVNEAQIIRSVFK